MCEFSDLLFMTGTLLSKASHSDELVARIDHADINCEFFIFKPVIIDPGDHHDVEEGLRTLLKGIGVYLWRVVGSVPIDLKITLQVYDKSTSESVFDPSPVTFGPLYYEGQ